MPGGGYCVERSMILFTVITLACLAAIMVAGSLIAIVQIGQPRKPRTAWEAAFGVVFNGFFIFAVILAALELMK